MTRTIKMDLTGQRYGRLIVVSRAPNMNRHVMWHCVCDCGGECDVQTGNLIFGNQRSCGCYRRERASETHSKN